MGCAVIKVMVQLREASMAARRRNGVKWPTPALGKSAICGCGGGGWRWPVMLDIVMIV